MHRTRLRPFVAQVPSGSMPSQPDHSQTPTEHAGQSFTPGLEPTTEETWEEQNAGEISDGEAHISVSRLGYSRSAIQRVLTVYG